uniref:Uncharacterized protein n=1 Tax=Anguilla anguilla TaxID=7936 RepID=A0A0E9SEW0_ANGAN
MLALRMLQFTSCRKGLIRPSTPLSNSWFPNAIASYLSLFIKCAASAPL